jgi:hypothetical protein
VSELDLLAIARLRGACLKELLVPDFCISLLKIKLDEDESFGGEEKVYLHKVSAGLRSQVVQRIAQPLTRDWRPLNNRQAKRATRPTNFYFDSQHQSHHHLE